MICCYFSYNTLCNTQKFPHCPPNKLTRKPNDLNHFNNAENKLHKTESLQKNPKQTKIVWECSTKKFAFHLKEEEEEKPENVFHLISSKLSKACCLDASLLMLSQKEFFIVLVSSPSRFPYEMTTRKKKKTTRKIYQLNFYKEEEEDMAGTRRSHQKNGSSRTSDCKLLFVLSIFQVVCEKL